MPYYRGDCANYAAGDYYQGDYYRGDPGLLSGIGKFLGGVAKTVVSLAPGPLGAAGRAILKIGAGAQPSRAIQFAQGPDFAQAAASARKLRISGGPEVLPTFNGLPEQQPVGTMLAGGFIPGCQLRGTRPNKSGYYKQVMKGNPTQVVFIPKGSVCVKSRRINIANPRALRRAVRRAQGFAKMARRVMTFVDAKAPKGRARYKKK